MELIRIMVVIRYTKILSVNKTVADSITVERRYDR